MTTPAERFKQDPYFHQLTMLLYTEFEKCNQGGAGLTPTEVREACAFAWQMYAERNVSPVMLTTLRS